MTVDVTQADIESGVPNRPCGCPIYLACKRAGFPQAWVGETQIVMLGDYDDEIHLPRSARKFIRDFDLHKPVKPFSFELDV